jgi:hypothetical protein
LSAIVRVTRFSILNCPNFASDRCRRGGHPRVPVRQPA